MSQKKGVKGGGEEEGIFGQRKVQVLENRQVRQRVLRQAPPEDHQEGEVAASP